MSEKSPQGSFIVGAKPVAATSDALSSGDWAKVGIGVLCLVVGVVLMTATPASFPGALLLALGCVVLCFVPLSRPKTMIHVLQKTS